MQVGILRPEQLTRLRIQKAERQEQELPDPNFIVAVACSCARPNESFFPMMTQQKKIDVWHVFWCPAPFRYEVAAMTNADGKHCNEL